MAESECNNPDLFALARCAFRRLYQLETAVPTVSAQSLLTFARRHRIIGLLHAGGIIPADDLIWQRQVYGSVVHATRMQTEAARLWQELSPRIENLLLIKGPGLAQQAWPTPELRAYDDLDFRCNRGDYPALCRGLEQAGYRPQHADPRRSANLWHYGWGVTFFHPEGFMVEANHRLFPPSSPCPSNALSNGQNTVAVRHARIEDADICIPTPAAHLLLACIHALWHGGERLAWFADIAGLLVRHRDLPRQAARLARQDDFAHVALQASIRVANTYFGPGLIMDATLPPLSADTAGRVEAAAQRLFDTLQRGACLGQRECLAFQRQLVKPAQRIGLLLRSLFTPGDGDFQKRSFPHNLRALYWAYRPLRVSKQIVYPNSRQNNPDAIGSCSHVSTEDPGQG